MLGTGSPLFLKLFQQLPKVFPNKKLCNAGYVHTSRQCSSQGMTLFSETTGAEDARFLLDIFQGLIALNKL